MTFWDFLDKQISKLTVTAVAGCGIFILTGVVLWMLAADRTLADNDLFKTLSQAIVVQGLVGLAMAAWFTKRAADDTQKVEVAQPHNNPIPVSNQEQRTDEDMGAPDERVPL